jgi:hypothetical protein
MAQQPIRMEPVQSAVPGTLAATFQRTLAFPISRAFESGLPPSDIQEYAAEEAAFGRIIIDERGLSAGMRLHLTGPLRTLFDQWREVRAPFDQLLIPHIKDIEAIDRLVDEIADLTQKCDREISQREQQLESDTTFAQIKQRHDRAETRFEEKFAENNQRVATTWGYRWSYLLAIGCIGVAEWLINYDTFYLFTQVPAIAAGATIILGILLAFAADGHGTLLKQWSHRFGAHRLPAERLGDWRLFGFSTFSLLLVLGAAGGSRYAAALRSMAANLGPNLLGAEARIDINPLRDVLISLLANLAAWAVGVFIAYTAHDPDPEYMEATAERRAARRHYNRRRAGVDRTIASIRARFTKQTGEKQSAARIRARGVEEERNLLSGVREHDKALVNACRTTMAAGANRYRDALVQLSIQQKGSLIFVRAADGNPLTPYEYKSTPILVDAAFVRDLL